MKSYLLIWKKNECVCTEKGPTIFDTKNCWEYYFEQTKINDGEECVTINSLAPAIINYNNRHEFLYYIQLKL